MTSPTFIPLRIFVRLESIFHLEPSFGLTDDYLIQAKEYGQHIVGFVERAVLARLIFGGENTHA